MAKNSITDYDNVAANNTDIQSVDIDEGCAPSGINNAIREVMADLADVNDGTVPLASPDINGGTIDGAVIGGATAAAGTFTTLTANTSITGTLATAAQPNITSLGTIASLVATTADINGGTIDGVTIGGTTAGAGTFTTITAGAGAHTIGDGTGASQVIIKASSATAATLDFGDADDTNIGRIQYDNTTNSMLFRTNNSEAMRIDNSGNLLVGRTTVGNTGNGHSIRGGDSAIFSRNSSGETMQVCRNNSTGDLIRFYRNGTICGEIVNTGTTTVSYNTASDYRLKTDAEPMTGAIQRVNALKPVNFKWIADGNRVDGFLAHEAQAVVPEAVTKQKDAMREEEYEVTPAVLDEDGNVVTEAVMGTRSVPDYQGIDQSKLVPLLTAALQEAISEIETLKIKVAALENA